jgi:DNA-binding NarL/FixJ family response regulator
LPGGFSGPINNISLTIAGYFLFCVSAIVFFFRHYAKSIPIAAITNPAFIYLDARGITKRELEIIRLIIKGFSNRQIGDKLFISVSTVKKHIYNIFRKTHVNSRMALTAVIRKK